MRRLLESKDICQAQSNEGAPFRAHQGVSQSTTSLCLVLLSQHLLINQAILEQQPAASLPDIQDIPHEMWVALRLPLPDSCCKLPDLGTPALLCLGQIIIKSNMLLPQEPLGLEGCMLGIGRGKCDSDRARLGGTWLANPLSTNNC